MKAFPTCSRCWTAGKERKGREGFPGEKFPIFISENSDFLDCLIDGKNQKLKLIEVEELVMTY